jgi:hypothetical protein
MTGALIMDNQQQVRFRETTANGTNFIALQAPASVASDKTITLPDVTGTVVTTGDTGSVATAMVANDAVTYAKIQNVSATDRLLGRSTAGSGDIEEVACTAAGRALLDDADAAAQRTTLGLGTLATQSGTFSGTSSGTNTGDQTITLTGDVTGSGTGSFTTAIGSGVVVNADINASAAIAGTKISPDFGSQGVLTTSTVGASSILFNGDTAAANALDDYEEGSFTPTIVGVTTEGTGTYSTQVGRYTKIGNRVLFVIVLAWSAHTGTGAMEVAGLPFTTSSASSNNPACAWQSSNLTLPANACLSGFVVNNSTKVRPYSQLTGGGAQATVALDTAATLYISGHYEAA